MLSVREGTGCVRIQPIHNVMLMNWLLSFPSSLGLFPSVWIAYHNLCHMCHICTFCAVSTGTKVCYTALYWCLHQQHPTAWPVRGCPAVYILGRDWLGKWPVTWLTTHHMTHSPSHDTQPISWHITHHMTYSIITWLTALALKELANTSFKVWVTWPDTTMASHL